MNDVTSSPSPSSNAAFEATSFLYGPNAAYIEDLYARYLKDRNAVDADWRAFFDSLGEDQKRALAGTEGPKGLAAGGDAHEDAVPGRAAQRAESAGASKEAVARAARDSVKAIQIIRAYRAIGHLHADLDPLKLKDRQPAPPRMEARPADAPELDPETYGFAEKAGDWDRPIFIDGMLGLEFATMREIVEILRRTYCGTIGYEFIHITDPKQKAWIQERIEGAHKEVHFTPEGKRAILRKLIEAEGFERFCGVKFIGTKRFGLDGGEALIPAMEQIIKRGGQMGARELVLGMAHRGRLNVLANVMAKPFHIMFHEFKGGSANPGDVEGSGDVKYHLGTSSDRQFDGNKVHLSLTANPSHLEAVNPVVLGKARAKQQRFGERGAERKSVIPVLLHGDAAFAGQGVVAECFAMSGTKGYRTGGTIHFVINNQIGFTTDPMYARSSPYPSDVALMVQAPIIHVNGDDPEAVTFAAKVATEFRMTFHKDVVIDMFCYRRFGHNETDEPAFTQPIMYQAIKAHPTTMRVYADRLVAEGSITQAEVDGWIAEFNARLESELKQADQFRPNKADWLDGVWAGMTGLSEPEHYKPTGIEIAALKQVGAAIGTKPAGVNLHKTIERMVEGRGRMIETGEGIDWSTGEALAFGSLLAEGYPVRLSGQDTSRGTFSQRHAALVDQVTNERYWPLANVKPGQAELEVVDSLLSEAAVMGFEYGYSLAEPKALVMWEAQFGDFANGAQVIIDQFIASGAHKWLRLCGLVLLLPHGYEGQGPEHSSARLERFLQLCAEDNMNVGMYSTPANYFHALRRQLYRSSRRPLVLMTPKSLLRHKRAVSSLAEMGPGTQFQPILRDDAERLPNQPLALAPDSEIRRVILCSGKVYYDLADERDKRGLSKVYILRIEELHPYPGALIEQELRRFPHAKFIWAQEEPKNMGAWAYIEPKIEWSLNRIGRHIRASYAGRPPSASPATGLMKDHMAELQRLLDEALEG